MLHVDMTMADAKKDFKRGLVKGFELHRQMGLVYLSLDLDVGGARQVGEIVDARNGAIRSFKSFDAAIGAAEQIGFSVALLRGQ